MKEGSLFSVVLLVLMVVLPSSGRTRSAGPRRGGADDRSRSRRGGGGPAGSDPTLWDVSQGPKEEVGPHLPPRPCPLKSGTKTRRMKVVSPTRRVTLTTNDGLTNDSGTASVPTTAAAAMEDTSFFNSESTRNTSSSSSSFNLSTSDVADALLKMIHDPTIVDSAEGRVDSVC